MQIRPTMDNWQVPGVYVTTAIVCSWWRQIIEGAGGGDEVGGGESIGVHGEYCQLKHREKITVMTMVLKTKFFNFLPLSNLSLIEKIRNILTDASSFCLFHFLPLSIVKPVQCVAAQPLAASVRTRFCPRQGRYRWHWRNIRTIAARWTFHDFRECRCRNFKKCHQ